MSVQKDLKKIRKAAEEQGWRVEATGNGHWRCYAPDGDNIVHMSGTPEGQKAIHYIVSDLRRYGFRWQGR
jgi:hypothetical protein